MFGYWSRVPGRSCVVRQSKYDMDKQIEQIRQLFGGIEAKDNPVHSVEGKRSVRYTAALELL